MAKSTKNGNRIEAPVQSSGAFANVLANLHEVSTFFDSAQWEVEFEGEDLGEIADLLGEALGVAGGIALVAANFLTHWSANLAGTKHPK